VELFAEYVTVNNKQGEVVKYLGSGIFKVRYMEGNVTRLHSFRESEIDFNKQDVEYLKKRYR